jgi:hypothetical protein
METKMITVGTLLQAYSNVEKTIPQEILDLQCGTKLYDKKYLKIKEFFKHYVTNKTCL